MNLPIMLQLTARMRRILTSLVLIALLLAPFLILGRADAVSKTWDGGCGADITWSCANNWSDNIVPVAGDIVTFNSTSTNNSTVDSATFAGTIATININAGYTGTITLARSLTVTTTFSQTGTLSNFSAAGQTLTIAAFTLSGGSFTASSGTTSISGAMTISGTPTFTANGGTVNFNGTTTATLSCNSVTFNLVSFTHSAGTKTVSSNCSMPLGAGPTVGSGTSALTLNGTLSGSGTLTMGGSTGIFTFGTTGALSGFSGLAAKSLTVNGTFNAGSYSPFTVSGAYSQTAGTVTAPSGAAFSGAFTVSSGATFNATSGTVTFASTFTINSGASFTAPSGTASFASSFTLDSSSTFNANGGTVNFNGGTATLACGSKTFNLVTFTHTSGTKTVGSDCSLPLGSNPSPNSGGSITLNGGTLSGSGMLTTSGTLTLNSVATSACPGAAGGSASGYDSGHNGGSASGFGCGGGGGGWYGGTGGNGLYGGGGGGAGGGNVVHNGGAGGQGVVVFSPTGGTNDVRTSGSSYTVPAGVTSVKVWATGAGGGGAGVPGSDGTSGGGGGAGGVAYKTFTVNPGDTITYSLGTAGAGGGSSSNGADGGNTTVTYSATTITGGGGTGGMYNTGATAAGGTYLGGDGGTTGGTGSGAAGDTGGGGGGGTGGGAPTEGGSAGDTGGSSNDVSGLFAVLTDQGYSVPGTSGALTGFSGLSANALTVNGTYGFGSYSTFSVSSTFTLGSGGSFIAPSGTATFSGDFTLNSAAAFSANGGTVNFNGGSATLACGNQTFNYVTFTHTGGTKTVGTDCSLPLGNNPNANSGGSIDLKGALSGSGTLTTSGTLTLGTASSTANNINGQGATGFGDGGGGAGWYGGNGGYGLYGGGGGGAAGYTATNRAGGTGGQGVVVLSPNLGAADVLVSGTSYTVPDGVTSVKVWAIGAGGGGAGSTNVDSGAGGGGGGGGTVYQTFSVTPGDTISYSLGTGGAGGINTGNGSAGGDTTVTVGATTITTYGGAGGTYNNGAAAAGGSYLGGDGGMDGAPGSGATGNTGGGGGGGIGSTNVPPSLAVDNISGNDGTPVNGANTVAGGKLNRAGNFTSSNYLSISDNITDLSSDFSVEMWVNPTNTSGTNPRTFSLVSGSLNLQVGYRSGTMLPYVRIGNVTYSISQALTVGSWQHVTYVKESGVVTIYVNDTAYSTSTGGAPTANTTVSAINFGDGGSGGNTLLDEVVLYNRALTSDEVTGRYNGGSGTENLSGSGWDVSSAAVSQWHMNEAYWDASSSYSGGATEGDTAGDTGGQSQDVSGLFIVLSGLGYPTTAPGSGGGSSSGLSGSTGVLSGFSGLAANNLTVNSTQDFGSYSPFTVSGDFILNSTGSFTAPAGTASFSGNFTLNSGSTLNANGGTINFNGGTAALSCTNQTFNRVTFTHTSGTKTVGIFCSFPLGNNPSATSGGSIYLNGALSGSGTLTAGGTLTLGGAGRLSGLSGLAANVLVVNGNYNFGSYNTFTVSGDFTLSGTFTAPASTATFSSTFTVSPSSIFNANGGTVNFNGGSASLACGGKTFNLVTFTHASGTKTVNSDCSLPLGANPNANSGGSITLNGTLSGSGTLTTSGTLTLGSTGALSGLSGLSAATLTVSGTYNFSSYSTFVVNGAYTQTGGTVSAPNGADFNGNFGVNGGATFSAPAGTVYFAGDFSNAGTFNANGGTVVLDGAGQTLSGNTTFYNLTKTVTSSDTLTFNAGDTVTVSGKLILQGADLLNLLALASSISGSSWLIDATGTTSVSYVDVSNSSSTGTPIIACNSIDGGGNTGWLFNPAACHPNKNGLASSTGIANFQLLQAYLATQSSQKLAQNSQRHANLSGLPGKNAFPSRIYSFAKHFPAGRGLIKAAVQLLRAILVGLVLIVLIVAFIAWLRRRHREKPHPPEETPTIITPTRIHISLPGGQNRPPK